MSDLGTRRSPSPGRPAPARSEEDIRPVPLAERAHPVSAPPAGPKAAPPPGGAPYNPFPGGPRGPRRRGPPWLWIIAGVVLLGLIGYAVWPKPAAQGPGQLAGGGRGGPGGGLGGGRFAGAPTSVNIAKVATADVPVYLNALGTVTPTATVTVRPQVSGQLMQVAFQEGQMVEKGQFLAQIDPRPFQQTLNQAEATLARDQATLQNARETLQRYQTLLEQDSIARQQVDDQRATVRSLEATIRNDEAQVGAAKLNLTYARIVSPVAGRVGLRRVDVGNYVSTGDTNGVVVVTQVAPIDVLFTAPEDQLPQLNKRIHEGGDMRAEAFDRSQSTKLAEGKFLTLDNQVDTATGTVKVKARFTNADSGLFPNQFVNIRLLIDTVKGALTIPSSAVQRGPDGMFVYVVQPDRTVTVRAIKPGVVSGAQTVVASGLKLGETVVIDGADRLREGARVLLPGDCPPTLGQNGQRRAGQNGSAAAGAKAGGQAGQGGQAGCTPAPTAGGLGFSGQGGAQAGQGAGAGLLAALNLDPDQMQKARAALAAARARADISPGDPDARRQAMRKAFAEIEPILRPDQKEKLKALQANGGGFGLARGPQGPN